MMNSKMKLKYKGKAHFAFWCCSLACFYNSKNVKVYILLFTQKDDISSKSEIFYFPLILPKHRNLQQETKEVTEGLAESNKQVQFKKYIFYYYYKRSLLCAAVAYPEIFWGGCLTQNAKINTFMHGRPHTFFQGRAKFFRGGKNILFA